MPAASDGARATTPTEQELQKLLARRLNVSPDAVPLDADLLEELPLDSFEVVAVIVEIEDAFPPVRIAESDADELRTLHDVAAYIDRQLGAP